MNQTNYDLQETKRATPKPSPLKVAPLESTKPSVQPNSTPTQATNASPAVDPIMFNAFIRHCGEVKKPTEEQRELIRIIGKSDLKHFYEALEIFNSMYLVANEKKPGTVLDYAFVFWSIYSAGVMAGKREERARRKQRKE